MLVKVVSVQVSAVVVVPVVVAITVVVQVSAAVSELPVATKRVAVRLLLWQAVLPMPFVFAVGQDHSREIATPLSAKRLPPESFAEIADVLISFAPYRVQCINFGSKVNGPSGRFNVRTAQQKL